MNRQFSKWVYTAGILLIPVSANSFSAALHSQNPNPQAQAEAQAQAQAVKAALDAKSASNLARGRAKQRKLIQAQEAARKKQAEIDARTPNALQYRNDFMQYRNPNDSSSAQVPTSVSAPVAPQYYPPYPELNPANSNNGQQSQAQGPAKDGSTGDPNASTSGTNSTIGNGNASGGQSVIKSTGNGPGAQSAN